MNKNFLLIGGALLGIGVYFMTTKRLSNAALEQLKIIEGYSGYPYVDAHGYSIGYGHFILPDESFIYIDEAEATRILMRDVARFERAVNSAVKVPVNQNQFDAMVLLAYNIGTTAFKNSTLVKKLNALDYIGASKEFLRWDKSTSNGVTRVNDALSARRELESNLFTAAV